MNVLDSIAEMLHQEYGFDASSPGPESLRRMVVERCQATERRTEEEYLFLLENSPEERHALLEAVIVPETFFFRHREAFAALVEWVLARGRFPVRVLSAACSTGEEPYSVAMALLDAGLVPEQFYIEACDVSAASLAHARKGIYTSKAFRSEDQTWREQYFSRVDDGWKLKREVRQLVHFRLGNLLTLEGRGAWDAIFCRNVMIYFSKERQAHVVETLRAALSDDGLLFLGPAEPPVFLANGWSSSGYAMSFACLKQQSKPRAEAQVSSRSGEMSKKRPSAMPRKVPPAPPATVAVPAVAEVQPEPVTEELDAARKLADDGRLPEADAALERLSRRQPENAEVYFLWGLVAESQSRYELAESHYRKALYLAPGHAETLQHMALLLRRQGRQQAAENLLRRAGRHSLT